MKYKAKKVIDLIITANLNTEIMPNEWLIKFKKLIFDGPKYR